MKKESEIFEGIKLFEKSGLELKVHVKKPNSQLSLRRHITHHRWFEFMFIPSNEIYHYINDKVIKMETNTLCLIRPDDVCDFMVNPVSKKHYYIYQITVEDWLMEDVFKFLEPNMSLAPLLKTELPLYITLNKVDASNLLNHISVIQSYGNEHSNEACLELKKLIISLLTQYFYSYLTEQDGQREIPLWLIRTVNQMRYSENFSIGVSRMTELSGKTNEHLTRSMKKYYGVSPIDFVNDIRLSYAANLLIKSTIPIGDIFSGCGFQSRAWMVKQFGKKYGMSPREYRKKIGGEEQESK